MEEENICKNCMNNERHYGNDRNWCQKFNYIMADDDYCSYFEGFEGFDEDYDKE